MDPIEAAVVIQRRKTLIGPLLFIMTFISYIAAHRKSTYAVLENLEYICRIRQ